MKPQQELLLMKRKQIDNYKTGFTSFCRKTTAHIFSAKPSQRNIRNVIFQSLSSAVRMKLNEAELELNTLSKM